MTVRADEKRTLSNLEQKSGPNGKLLVRLPFTKWIFLKIFAFLESSGWFFLLRFWFQCCLVTFIFDLYVMVSTMLFWPSWLDGLCWGWFEAGENFLGMILSIRVRRMPTWSLVISASVLSWEIQQIWEVQIYLIHTVVEPSKILPFFCPNLSDISLIILI